VILFYPIKVVVWNKYNNMISPDFDRGAIVKEKFATENGVLVKEYFVLKKYKTKIPFFDIKNFYKDINGKITVHLFRVSKDLFLPMMFTDERVYIPKGTVVDGKKLEDDIVLLDAKIILDEEKNEIIPLTNIIPKKVYDKDHWLSSEIEDANKRYMVKNFWAKYGNVVIMFIIIFGMVSISFLALKNMSEMATKIMEAQRLVTEGLKETANAMRDVAASLRMQNQTIIQKPPV
jgi:hypothetical protein